MTAINGFHSHTDIQFTTKPSCRRSDIFYREAGSQTRLL